VTALAADLASFLAQVGGAVGGGTVLFGSVGFVAGSFLRDLSTTSAFARERGWDQVDPIAWASRLAPFGGVAGLAALALRALEVR
jgi:hypothetical protein